MSALLCAIALATIMLALKAAYHVIAIRRLGNQDGPASSVIVSAYATAQVIRYLPGKVLGLVYETTRLSGKVPAYRIVAANLVQDLLTSALTVGIVATTGVWLLTRDAGIASCTLAIVFAALWGTHRLHLAERSLAWIAGRLPRLRGLSHLEESANRGALVASVILLIEWVPYFGFWALLLPGGSSSLHEAIVLGGCYAAASLIANFAVLMPSGLIVREALFLWAGTQLSIDPADLIVLGLISRALFTLADGIFVPFAWIYGRALSGIHT